MSFKFCVVFQCNCFYKHFSLFKCCRSSFTGYNGCQSKLVFRKNKPLNICEKASIWNVSFDLIYWEALKQLTGVSTVGVDVRWNRLEYILANWLYCWYSCMFNSEVNWIIWGSELLKPISRKKLWMLCARQWQPNVWVRASLQCGNSSNFIAMISDLLHSY